MNGTHGMILTENRRAVKQGAAGATGLVRKELARWLDASGPLLKLASLSAEASDLVHSYRYIRDVAAVSPAGVAMACYRHVRHELGHFLQSGGVESQLRDIVELELKRADVLITEAGKWPKRTSTQPRQTPLLSQDGADLLHAWTQRMKSEDVSREAVEGFATFMGAVNAHDWSWGPISEVALNRAKRIKQRFPNITRQTYNTDAEAVLFIDKYYTIHGKGEMFEAFARNSDAVKSAADRELRAAVLVSAQKGESWKAVISIGELQLATTNAKGQIAGWKKFADSGILIVNERTDVATAFAAQPHGIAQPTALFEFKAEAGISGLGSQQGKAMQRMGAPLEQGAPLYVALTTSAPDGQFVTKTYLLGRPDPKVGLSYYGVGTSNSFIKQRAILAKQGALTANVNIGISNDSMKAVWMELFWTAFERLD